MSWSTVVLMIPGAVASVQERDGANLPSLSSTVVLRDVEVNAKRGSARVLPEIEYDGTAIDAFAAWNINEVVARASERAGDRDPPVIIINGKRVADPSIFLDFPPGALNRMELLPPEAATIYGAAPGLRVINLVMEPRFESAALQVGGSRPSAGGTSTLDADLRRASLNNGATTTYGGKVTTISSLRAGERPSHILDQMSNEAVTLRPGARILIANLAVGRLVGDWSSSLRLEIQSMSNQGAASLGGVLRRNRSDTDSVSANIGLTGEVQGWQTQTEINAGLNRSEQRGLFDSRQRVWSYGGLLNANRSLMNLPMGDLQANLSMGHNQTSSEIDLGERTSMRREDRTTRITTLRGALTAPLARRTGERSHHSFGLGEVSLGVGGNLLISNTGRDQGIDLSLNWTPFERLRFNASQSTNSKAPTADQLYAPLIYGDQVAVFDLVAGEFVQALPIMGGNPDLRPQSSETLSVSMSAGPFKAARLFLNLNYRRTETRDDIAYLTEVTPALEAAFPDRFIRDDVGRLIAIDRRPLNAALASSDSISTNVSAGLPLPWKINFENQRLQLNVSHTYRMTDVSWFGPGAPIVDRISGVGGGQPRQLLFLSAETRSGRWSLTGTGRWQSRYSLRRGGQPSPDDLGIRAFSALDFKIAFTLKPRLNTERETIAALGEERVSGGGQITLEIQNLFDARPEGTLGDSRPAPGFGRNELDPIGRSVRLQLAKRF